jgi:hypothetical protein
MTIKIITAPTEEPVSLDEAKVQCSVDNTAVYDELLNGLISSARQQAEHETGRALCTQVRERVLDGFLLYKRDPVQQGRIDTMAINPGRYCAASGSITLRGSPIASVDAITYLDAAGQQQTLAPTEYIADIDSEPGRVLPAYGKTWPATYPVPNAVRIRYTCGYGAASAVPQAIKQWMKLVISTLFDQRGIILEGRIAAVPERLWDRLLDAYRIYNETL